MKALKIFTNMLTIGYAIFLALLLTNILDKEVVFQVSTAEQTLLMYQLLVASGAGFMLLKLFTDSLYIAAINHERHMAQLKINELKADLYEKRQEFRSNRFTHPASVTTTLEVAV